MEIILQINEYAMAFQMGVVILLSTLLSTIIFKNGLHKTDLYKMLATFGVSVIIVPILIYNYQSSREIKIIKNNGSYTYVENGKTLFNKYEEKKRFNKILNLEYSENTIFNSSEIKIKVSNFNNDQSSFFYIRIDSLNQKDSKKTFDKLVEISKDDIK